MTDELRKIPGDPSYEDRLRDQAALANDPPELAIELAEILAGEVMPDRTVDPEAVVLWSAKWQARYRYICADAFMAERAKRVKK